MNAMLASGAYPWTVIRNEDRDTYLDTLNTASIEGDISPFADLLTERVQWAMGTGDKPDSWYEHAQPDSSQDTTSPK